MKKNVLTTWRAGSAGGPGRGSGHHTMGYGRGIDMGGVPEVSNSDFSRFQRLIHDESGIFLTEAKKSLLAGRLSERLRVCGVSSFAAYFEVVRGDKDELQEMLDRICTTETRFFREAGQIEFLAKELLPSYVTQAERGQRPRGLRIWSASCATGEEPYSLAMVANRFMPASLGWQVEIVATDLCKRALRQARRGIWPIEQADQIPEYYRKRYMLRGVRAQAGSMAAGIQLRALIRFQHANLINKVYPVRGLFDLIFCRNTLMYFERSTRHAVVRRLFKYLHPDGSLFLGHAESLSCDPSTSIQLIHNVYTRRHTEEWK